MSTTGRRRMPNFTRFIISGAVIGFVLGLAVAVIGDEAPVYGAGTQLGYLGVAGAGLGALLAGLLAVLLERRG